MTSVEEVAITNINKTDALMLPGIDRVATQKIAGSLIIALALTTALAFFILRSVFNFPNILTERADIALTLFNQSSQLVIFSYSLYLISGLIMLPVSLALSRELATKQSFLGQILSVFGVVAGILQILSTLRWIFSVPGLAQSYATDPTTQKATEAAYYASSELFGVSLNENLAALVLAGWSLLLSVVLLQGSRVKMRLAWAGLIIAVLNLVGGLQLVNTVANPVLAVLFQVSSAAWVWWLVALGLALLQPQFSKGKVKENQI